MHCFASTNGATSSSRKPNARNLATPARRSFANKEDGQRPESPEIESQAMPIDVSRLWQQVALGEDTDLNLKEARFLGGRIVGPGRDALADELAAFANARGGRVVLGVSDNRRPQSLGPLELDALANLVTEICSDSIKPPLDFSIFRVAVPDPAEGGALVVEIPESAPVHRSPGGHFRRRGDKATRSGRWTPRRSAGCHRRGGGPTRWRRTPRS